MLRLKKRKENILSGKKKNRIKKQNKNNAEGKSNNELKRAERRQRSKNE